jgi:hypothetical protein
MQQNGFSEFEPGHLYEWATCYCETVAKNCTVTADLAMLMATYRKMAKFGDRIGLKRKYVSLWEKDLCPLFIQITCYLHDRAVKKEDI